MIMVMMVSSESSWAFPESCILELPTIVEVSAPKKMVANRKKKFTSKVSFRTTAQLELEFKCLAGSHFNCLWFMDIFRPGLMDSVANDTNQNKVNMQVLSIQLQPAVSQDNQNGGISYFLSVLTL